MVIYLLGMAAIAFYVFFLQKPQQRHAPGSARAAAERRAGGGLMMAVGAVIALTSGLCTFTMVAYVVSGTSRLDSILFTILIGLPLPGAGVLMFLQGRERMQAEAEFGAAADPPPPGADERGDGDDAP